MGLWTQNHPQVVGTCPGHAHGPQFTAQNRSSRSFRADPPPLSLTVYNIYLTCNVVLNSQFCPNRSVSAPNGHIYV